MSDKVARAVGAGDPEPIKIAGKDCTIRALSIRELTEVERDCLKQYKRQFLETYRDNIDLLPQEDRMETMKAKLEEAARWDVQDLPLKYAYDPNSLRTNGALEDWAKKHLDYNDKDAKGNALDSKVAEVRLQRVLAAALDSETLKPEQYTKLCGHEPRRVKIGYANWWITAAFEGMVALVYACVKEFGVTKEELFAEMSKNPTLMVNLSRDIEHLSAPQAGNG